MRCHMCGGEEYLRESKEDNLIYCEVCITELAEAHVQDWIDDTFVKLSKKTSKSKEGGKA